MVELQNRLSEESKKADKMEFEYKRLKEKVDSLQKEKDVRIFNVTKIRTDDIQKNYFNFCLFCFYEICHFTVLSDLFLFLDEIKFVTARKAKPCNLA